MAFFDNQNNFENDQVVFSNYKKCPICKSVNTVINEITNTIRITCKDCTKRISSFKEYSNSNPYIDQITAFDFATYDFVSKKSHWRTRNEHIWVHGLKIEKNIRYDTYRHYYTVHYGTEYIEITPTKFVKKFEVSNWDLFLKNMLVFSSAHLKR